MIYYKLFALFGITLIILFGIVVYKDHNREWKKYQHEYIKLELKKAKTKKEKDSVKTNIGIKQILVNDLKKADRCTTCHMGIENPKFANAKNPYKTHPGTFLTDHPLDKFGCTICHRGQGRATTKAAAHGRISHWEKPMLEKEYVQVSCGKCHSEKKLKGASLLTLAKKLYLEKGCGNCHKIKGISNGNIAPDLTVVGSKYPHEFALIKNIKIASFENDILKKIPSGRHKDYLLKYYVKKEKFYKLEKKDSNKKEIELNRKEISIIGGILAPVHYTTTERWIYEHFLDPQAVTPGTIMPNFNFTPDEAKALTIYMLSLTKDKIPYEYRAGHKGIVAR